MPGRQGSEVDSYKVVRTVLVGLGEGVDSEMVRASDCFGWAGRWGNRGGRINGIALEGKGKPKGPRVPRTGVAGPGRRRGNVHLLGGSFVLNKPRLGVSCR